MQRVHLEWSGDSLELPVGETVIGRGQSCALRLDDRSVSRRHVRLVHRTHEVFVEDLGSSNGTLVNGTLVDGPAPLADGDTLAVGNRVLRVHIIDDSVTDEPTTLEIDALPPCDIVDEDSSGLARRRAIRQRIELQLVYASTELELEAVTHDLSETGVFVCSPVLDPIDTTCTLTIHLDDGHEVQLRGVVRRVVDRQAAGGVLGGLGVEFIALGAAERTWLRAQVSRAAASA